MNRAENILNEYLWLIRHVVFQKIHSDDAEDVVNTIVCKICQNYRSIRSPDTVGAWVRAVVKNQIASWYRQKERNKLMKKAYLESGVVSSYSDYDILETMIRSVTVDSMLSRLPEKCRYVLVLRYLREFDHSEIAHVLGITTDEVSNQISYAKKLVRKCLPRADKISERVFPGDSVVKIGDRS